MRRPSAACAFVLAAVAAAIVLPAQTAAPERKLELGQASAAKQWARIALVARRQGQHPPNGSQQRLASAARQAAPKLGSEAAGSRAASVERTQEAWARANGSAQEQVAAGEVAREIDSQLLRVEEEEQNNEEANGKTDYNHHHQHQRPRAARARWLLERAGQLESLLGALGALNKAARVAAAVGLSETDPSATTTGGAHESAALIGRAETAGRRADLGAEKLARASPASSLGGAASSAVFGRLAKKTDWNALFVKLAKVFVQYFVDLILSEAFGTTGELCGGTIFLLAQCARLPLLRSPFAPPCTTSPAAETQTLIDCLSQTKPPLPTCSGTRRSEAGARSVGALHELLRFANGLDLEQLN